MIKYNVWFKNFRIGELYINDEGQYKYVVDMCAVEQAEKDDMILADAKTNQDWSDPIPFFETRIANCKRFGVEDKISYPNSEYYFIKDNGDNWIMSTELCENTALFLFTMLEIQNLDNTSYTNLPLFIY